MTDELQGPIRDLTGKVTEVANEILAVLADFRRSGLEIEFDVDEEAMPLIVAIFGKRICFQLRLPKGE